MTKRKKSRSIRRLLRKPSFELLRQIKAAKELVEEGDLTEARDQLLALAEEYPDNQEVLSPLLEVCQELQDWHNFILYGEKVLPTERGIDQAILLNNLLYACTQLSSPALICHYATELTRRHPHYDNLPAIKKLAADTRQFLLEQAADFGTIASLPEDKQLAAMVNHERVKLLNEVGRLEEAIILAEEVLAEVPDLTAVLNNLSLAHYTLGHIDEAITATQRVLEINPQNYHALGNIVRYLFFRGHFDEAEAYAQQLAQIEGDDFDIPSKQAEAFSYLGKDEQVWAAYERAKALNHDQALKPLLLHLAATAAYRLGKPKRAWRLWRLAASKQPRLEWAAQCLAEETLPVGLRSVPWYWPLNYWLDAGFKKRLSQSINNDLLGKDDSRVVDVMAAFLAERPYFRQLIPHILDRSDEPARDFVINFIRFAQAPDLLAVLYEFAQGRRGTDETRLKAMQFVAQNHPHLLPANRMVPMWINGKQNELIMMAFAISHEPQPVDLPPEVLEKHETAYELILEDRIAEAEPLLHEIIAAAPDFPAAYNHLALVHERQGREDKAWALTEEMLERFPDYLFAQATKARKLIRKEQLDEAQQILNKLLTRTELHISEFQALAVAEIELALANGRIDAAKSWLGMWQQVDPDNPEPQEWEARIEAPARIMETLRGFRQMALDRKR